ncbi:MULTISPECIES: Pr6Pr family membrane protein [Actinoplanes]|uniref:Pr6Pr family membrane protein n=1 Tax=Actinoplanes TaxID=1865 RepID=UPI0005F2E6A1|nr:MULTISPECIES: Pr6Pr family membrane protein [Actinoplanes]GLY00957.1 hypothetical protein Acsp01_13360 [Actinoplanes sp. NBRC 101535]
MSILWKPPLWWRAAIVVCVVVGLLSGEQRVLFYTCQSNLIVLGYFGAAVYLMVRRRTPEAPAPRLRGPVTLWILITCLISHFVLNAGASPLPGLSDPDLAVATANRSLFLVHYVVPLMVVIDWVAFGPRRASPWRDLPWWLVFPLLYGVLSVFRAVVFPTAPFRYPYPFLDPGVQGGYGGVAVQMASLAVVFAVLGALLLGVDRLMALVTRGPVAVVTT